MSVCVALNHKSRYSYGKKVTLGPHIVRLRPAPSCRTPIQKYSLTVQPTTHFLNWQQDPHGNHLARLVIPDKTDELAVEVDLMAVLTEVNPFDFFVDDSALRFPFSYEALLRRDLQPFLYQVETGRRFDRFVEKIYPSQHSTVDALVQLNQRLRQEIEYEIRMEPGVRTPDQTLQLGAGSCRDSAWLLVQILRRLGVASRFVSGYLIQLADDDSRPSAAPRVETDAAELHAWTEAFVPGAGWIGLDGTSGMLASEGHLPLACTPHPQTAAPVSGTVEECAVQFCYEMSMRRYS